MADDNFLIKKFLANLTPRRAIERFIQVATPTDSPDPTSLVQIPLGLHNAPDATPAIGSSQGSQKSGTLKRKLATHEQAETNVSKRSMVEIPESELLDSILNDTEMPSEVGSPSIIIPRHRPNERCVSTTAFSQAIQSQESQPATDGNISNDESLPYPLASPVILSRFRSSARKKVSTSVFKEPLEGFNRLSSNEDSDREFPAEVPSPETIGPRRPSSRTTSRNESTSVYQEALNPEAEKPNFPDDLLEDSGSNQTLPLSDLSTDEIAVRPHTFANRVKKRISMSAFKAAFNQHDGAGATEIESLASSIEDLGDELTSQRPGKRPRKRVSSTLYKEVLSQQADGLLNPSETEMSPVMSTHSSLVDLGDESQEQSISSSSSAASNEFRKTNSPESNEPENASFLDIQQPVPNNSKKSSLFQKSSEGKPKELDISSNEERDEVLHQKEKSTANHSKNRSTGQMTSSLNKNEESDNSLNGSSSLKTPVQIMQLRAKNTKTRISTTQFHKVLSENTIDSDDEVLTLKEKSVANKLASGSTGRKTPSSIKSHKSDSSLSGPSSLETPEQVKKLKTKNISKRVSTTQFQKVLEANAKELEVIEEDDVAVIPLKLSASSKRISGSTEQKTPSSNKSEMHESDSSLSGPSSLYTPEQQVLQSKANKNRHVSSFHFRKALEEKAKESEIDTESNENVNKTNRSFHESTSDDSPIVPESFLHKSRSSFVIKDVQQKALSTTIRESAVAKTPSPEPSVFKRVYATAANLADSIASPSMSNKSPEIASESFAPLASSTQVPKKGLEGDFEEVEEEEEMEEVDNKSVAQTTIFSQKSPPAEEASGAVGLSDSELPTRNSPPNSAVTARHSESSGGVKKRQSMTEYLAALSQRHTPPKAKTPIPAERLSPRRTPAKSPTTNGASGRKSVAPSVDPSDITAPALQVSGKRDSLSVISRTRRSLKFSLNDPEVKDIESKIQILVDDPNDVDVVPPNPKHDSGEVVEETPSSGGEESVGEEEEEKIDVQFETNERAVVDYEVNDVEEEDENNPVVVTKAASSVSNRFSKKSSGGTMSPPSSSSKRYPNIKNSTIIADGGVPFTGGALSMSPISVASGSAVPTVQSTPSTPPRASKRPGRSVPQSPMFMSVMQKVLTKQISSTPVSSGRVTPDDKSNTQPASSEASPLRVSPVERQVQPTKPKTITPVTPNPYFSGKGMSRGNPAKGKSVLTLPVVEEAESDSEWEDEPVSTFDLSILLNVASKPIVDRTKDFIPLEKRLKADPLFQAKVKFQKDKLATEKAAASAAAAKRKLTTPKKPRASRKKVEDNITNVATNKANLKFYARTKVSKEALDSFHDLVDEWFNFTLDQLEIFLADEGKDSLETWEDCAKMLRKQGIAKNYLEYSGLIREVLTYDESAKLLPSGFPPGHEEAKLEAKSKAKSNFK